MLVSALEITVQQSPLAVEMFLHGQDDRRETCLKNGLFSPRNCLLPICIPLMAQSLWKNNGPRWKRLRGTPTIVLGFCRFWTL